MPQSYPTIQRHADSVNLLPLIANRCEYERQWLFLFVCQPSNKLVTCPGCTLPLDQRQLGLAPVPATVTDKQYRFWLDGC